MKWSKLSHVGRVRKNNEDNSSVSDELQLLAVADGMGGHKAGEIASKMALDEMMLYLNDNRNFLLDYPGDALKKAVTCANTKIYDFAQQDGENFRGMGTTISVVLPRGNKIYVAHVGDSRVYLVRAKEIKLLTSDHSLVNELMKNGGLTPEEALNHPRRNVLTRAIGTSPEVEVDIDVVNVESGDLVILCTDGLSNMLGLDDLKEISLKEESLEERVKHLTELALKRGGDDNITVILFEVE